MIHKAKKNLGLKKFSVKNFSPETSFFRTKKSLGQNFLKSQEALQKMCSAGEVCDKDIILEIGPGKGALTEKLLERALKVIAIEKDHDLIEILKEKFSEEIKSNKLILIEGDILKFEFSTLIKNLPLIPSLVRRGETPSYKIIANIPYNITGAIFKKFLSSDTQPEKMVLLVQKEVAERIVSRPAKGGARDGKESILSLSVKVYGTPKYIMKVHKRFFTPSPKVDSAIISINNISRENFKTKIEEDDFFKIIKTGFAHKRKVLRKNLENFSKNKEVGPACAGRLPDIKEVFEKLGIDSKARAEDIKIEKWLQISHSLSTEI